MRKTRKTKRTAPREEDIVWTNRCYGYARVSTKHQVDDGMSLEVQHKKINAWAVMQDHELISIFADEGVTGTSIEPRKKLTALLETIKQGETLVTLSFSRLSRSARDFLNILYDLTMKGCRVVVINENLDTRSPYGKFCATMFSAVAELEADIISHRVTDAMNLKKEKGEFVGRIPYGWKLANGSGSGLVEIPEEQAIIKKIKELRASFTLENKQYSYEAIAKRLNAEKIKPPGKATEWSYKQVSRIHNRGPVKTLGRSSDKPASNVVEKIERTYSSDEEEPTDKVL